MLLADYNFFEERLHALERDLRVLIQKRESDPQFLYEDEYQEIKEAALRVERKLKEIDDQIRTIGRIPNQKDEPVNPLLN